MKYLTVDEVIFFNFMLIEEHGGREQAGVKDMSVLESAVERPKQTVFDKAAALLESLVKNHPFHNANKRTAFLSMVNFLKLNGYDFEMGQKEAEDFVVDVVVKRYGVEQIADIIKRHSRKE